MSFAIGDKTSAGAGGIGVLQRRWLDLWTDSGNHHEL